MLVLGTPGLRLRDLVTDDWSLVLALAQDRAVTRFQTSLPRPTETDARQWVEEAIRHNGREPRRAYNLAIVLDEAAVGWIGAGRAEEHGLDAYEVGYALLPSAWGRGAMTEALIAVVAFVLDDLGGERVVGVCSSVNRASATVMERAGFRLVDRRTSGTGAEDELRYVVEAADRRAGGPLRP